MAQKIISGSALRARITPCLTGKADDFASATFWHYTSSETALRIMAPEEGRKMGFLASKIRCMNDCNETIRHQSIKERLFILSFCNTDKEKIPMWYMYSDIEGRGIALGITPGEMRDWINSISTIYPFGEHGVDYDTPLVKGEDYDLETGWVAYQNMQEPTHYRVRQAWYDKIVPLEDFERDNYFIKLYPWYYEDEFRIVIKFKEDKNFDKVFIPLPQTKIKVFFGPGFEEHATDIEQFKKKMEGRNVVKSYQRSVLQLNMNLCKRHYRAFLKYIERQLAQK